MNISPISLVSKSPNFGYKTYYEEVRESYFSDTESSSSRESQDQFSQWVDNQLFVRDAYGNWYNSGVFEEIQKDPESFGY